MPVRLLRCLTDTALRAARWIAAGAGEVPLPPIPSPERFYQASVRAMGQASAKDKRSAYGLFFICWNYLQNLC